MTLYMGRFFLAVVSGAVIAEAVAAASAVIGEAAATDMVLFISCWVSNSISTFYRLLFLAAFLDSPNVYFYKFFFLFFCPFILAAFLALFLGCFFWPFISVYFWIVQTSTLALFLGCFFGPLSQSIFG